MIFLVDADFGAQIRVEVLNIIKNAPDSVNQNNMELAAIEEMSSYLGNRYDCALVFAATGSDRNPLVVMYCVDILLYHLHTNVNPRNIPELRVTRYKDALAWLDKVNLGRLPANLPVLEGEETGPFKLGSNTKRSKEW